MPKPARSRPSAPPDPSASAPVRRDLPGGLIAVAEAMPGAGSVATALLLPFGAAVEPDAMAGASRVLAEWMERGAGERDARAWRDALDDLGVRAGGGSGREACVLRASLLPDALDGWLGLLADQALRPRLDDASFGPARDLALADLDALDDEPAARLAEALDGLRFAGAWGRPPTGERAALEALEPGRLRAWADARLRPGGAVLAVAGRLDPERALDRIEAAFGAWRGAAAPPPPIEVRPPAVRREPGGGAQAQIGLTWDGIAPDAPERVPFALALEVLSGGPASRLFREVRERRGLVYDVGAASRAVRGAGWVEATASATPGRAEEALATILREVARLREGVTDAEHRRAATSLATGLALQADAPHARAGALVSDVHLRGAPRGRAAIEEAVRACTRGDVERVLRRLPPPEPAVLVLEADA